LGIIFGIVIIVPLILYITLPSSIINCDTIECFVSNSNNCSSVMFVEKNDIGEFRYFSNDCLFTKTLVKSGENEAIEIKEVVEGKSLYCNYNSGEFNEKWLTDISSEIDFCWGDLKEVIGELFLFNE
jgi:hypothetical protein